MAEFGRISGPLLKANLERDGADLAFETDLLYLSVQDLAAPTKLVGIGIKTDVPSRSLTIEGLTSTVDLIADTTLTTPKFYVSTNRIQSLVDPIVISPNQATDPTVATTQIGTANLRIRNNIVENITLNSDINLTANGLGKVTFTTSKVDVDGNLHATGDITWDGNITFGSDDDDSVTFSSDIASDIIPNETATYNLGSVDNVVNKRWNNLHTKTLDSDLLEAPEITVNNIDLLLTQGNTYYVSVNGADTNVGDHLHNTFKTIKYALSVASAGDEIVIFPGTYVEEFPLTVPQGVTVKGAGIRSVTIEPTIATNTNDCFLLNGETTVGFLTVQGFYSPGYAFKLAPGYSASIKSPYIYNVSVITSAIEGTLTPGQITPGPGTTLTSYTSDSVNLDKTFYSQELVDSLVGQIAVIDRYPAAPLFYTIVSIETEPFNPGLWRMTVDTTFDTTGWLKPISFYPDVGTTFIVTNDNFDTTGSSIGEPWVAYFKTNLPLDFDTVVGSGWSINIAGVVYVVDYIIEDPVNTDQWRIYVTTSLVASSGIPIFSSPTGNIPRLAGNGALVDGAVAANTSAIIPTMLFYSVTFIVPNAKGVVATNNARVEWLNSFTYFAETGIRLETGTEGFAGQGETRVTISGITGTVDVGDTFSYISNDDQTIIATGIVSSINGNEYSLDGFVGNLVTVDEIFPTEFISINNAFISESRFKFGGASLFLDGTNYISAPDSFKYHFEDSDFCIECWVYPEAFPTEDTTIIGHWGATTAEQSFNIELTDSGGLKISLNDSQDTVLETGIEFLLSEDDQIITDELGNPIISENSAIILNAWQHVAVVRNADTLTLYVNGVEKVSTTLVADDVVANSIGDITIGHSAPGTAYFIGHIDEVRISKGTPRYTDEFTPQTSQHEPDTSTVLLLHLDGVNGNQFFVDESEILQNIVFTNAVGRSIDALDYRDFAAEMRSINSANVYGTYGAVADGRDTLGYLVGHNFGYIGTGANSDNDQGLTIQANEVVENNYGTIYYDSVDHKGDYRVGDIFYVNQETGQVTFDAQALDFSASGNIILEGATSTTIINALYIQTGNLKIYDNTVESLSGSVNFSAFNNVINLNTNISVTGNLEISNNLVVDGNIFLGNNPLDTITIASTLTQSILPNANNLDIGSIDKRWDTLYSNLLDVDGVLQVTSSEISVLPNDVDLRLTPTGSVVITSNLEISEDVLIGDNLTVEGTASFKVLELNGLTTVTGDINQTAGNFDITGDLSSNNIEIVGDSYFYAPDIKIYSNIISVEATNEDLIITANGTGGVIFDNALKITNAVISNVDVNAVTNTDKSIILQPNGTGNLEINSDKSLVVPAGSGTNRTLSSNGEIRYNTQYNSYEGFSNTGAVSFNNITDSDRTTTITPETSIGADTDTIRFTIDSVVKSFVDSSKLFSNSLEIDTITVANNVINSSLDLEFVNLGSGSTIINDVAVKDSAITNNEDTAFVISSTPNLAGTGYVKFSGTGAVVFPFGPTEDRRSTPELAEVRFNSTLGYMEVFNGTVWLPAVGTQGAASQAQIEETLNLYALVLG